MAAFTSPEPAAFRYAPYIQELREFFAESHLRYGSPEDILAVSERLYQSQLFFQDLSSMVRSIILREGGSMQHASLLEILALAIGGPEMEHAPQHYRQPLRHLLSFVTGVIRQPWNIPPGERGELLPFPADAPAAQPAEFDTIPAAPADEAPEVAPAAHVPEPAAETWADPPPDPTAAPEPEFWREPEFAQPPEPFPAPGPDFWRDAEFAPPPASVQDPEFEPLPVFVQDPEFESPPEFALDSEFASERQPEPDPELAPVVSVPRTASAVESPGPSPLRRLSLSADYWKMLIAGAGALLLIVIVVFALRLRSSVHVESHPVAAPAPAIASTTALAVTQPPAATQPVAKQPPATIQPATTAPAAAQSSKPSAYGQSLPPQPRVRRSRTADQGGDYVAPPTRHDYEGWNPRPVPAIQPSSSQPATGQSSANQAAPRQQPAYNSQPAGTQSASAATVSATPGTQQVTVADIHRPAVSGSSAAYSANARGTNAEAHNAYEDWPGGASSRRGTSFSVSSGVMASNLISAPPPDYPTMARLAHIQGEVILQAVISKDGTISATHVLSGPRLLRGAAVDAVRRWRYRPYRMDGHPVDVATVITVGFHR
jgi:TonB family protein